MAKNIDNGGVRDAIKSPVVTALPIRAPTAGRSCINMDEAIVNQGKIIMALEIALDYGQSKGERQKAWVIDQIVRTLSGDKYPEEIKDYCEGNYGPNSYDWDEGIVPVICRSCIRN
jgi:hypothetical protein